MESCFNCGAKTNYKMFDYVICEDCFQKLRLFNDETIKRQNAEFKSTDLAETYVDELARRIEFLEKDYLKKKIKLLYIKDRLSKLV